MLKLFETPTQFVGNAIAFIILGLLSSLTVERWAASYYQLTILAMNIPLIWAFYKLTWAEPRDSRPMFRMSMFLVGTSLIGIYVSMREVFPHA